VDPIEVQRSGMLKMHIRSAMVATAGVLLALLLPTIAAGSVAPLPASNYLTRPACRLSVEHVRSQCRRDICITLCASPAHHL